MWKCPRCKAECSTTFCPHCGYQKPTQISESDWLIVNVKNLRKQTKLLTIAVIVLLILIALLTTVCTRQYQRMTLIQERLVESDEIIRWLEMMVQH